MEFNILLTLTTLIIVVKKHNSANIEAIKLANS